MKSSHVTSLPLATMVVAALLTGCANDVPTAPELDTTPPPAPANLSASTDAEGRQVLTWDASPAHDVVGYEVHVYSPSPDRPNAYVLVEDADPTDTTFLLRIVSSNMEETYRVRAWDHAGNRGAYSSATTVLLTAPNTGGQGQGGGGGSGGSGGRGDGGGGG